MGAKQTQNTPLSVSMRLYTIAERWQLAPSELRARRPNCPEVSTGENYLSILKRFFFNRIGIPRVYLFPSCQPKCLCIASEISANLLDGFGDPLWMSSQQIAHPLKSARNALFLRRRASCGEAPSWFAGYSTAVYSYPLRLDYCPSPPTAHRHHLQIPTRSCHRSLWAPLAI
jgi:hypothetical protein